jgi:hypothetical protein
MFWDSEPPHPAHLFVYHEAEGERNIALKGLSRQSYSSDPGLFFKEPSQRSYNIRRTSVDFEVELIVLLLSGNIPININSIHRL